MVPLETCGPFTIRQIVRAVVQFYSISLDEVLSATRKSRTARIRQIACYLAKALTDKSLPEIGRRIGGKDHTTVIYSLRKIESLLKTDPSLAAEIAELRIRLKKAEARSDQSESPNLVPPMDVSKQQAESAL
ncbi:helix-turn-helix domain-containing protein (plasmid) [Methylocapsa polymorpha]|uniref:Helix-turn-helix domain-containing protein n=1 Tax=Methylocapsa polymorpha TaxID=3080828 RepID=A0ABZ0HXT2_9HYPH|nr:helix-turn-helix domain-containing protein [Methylocapsa sp. RX1]WOJ91720.1 helix-turn-helix domain-containing protein [Methylocapsa sp. RX1]